VPETFDALLAAALLWIAWQALHSRDLFKAVVLFISFGLLMALAWVRLGAPDMALAEAAIGAGITGALLLDAVRQIGQHDPSPRPARPVIILAAALAATTGLCWRSWRSACQKNRRVSRRSSPNTWHRVASSNPSRPCS
jgi:uncharacterized MnhB-related membrane protein